MAIAFAVLFVAGTKWTHFVVLKPYQTDRLTAFLHPTSNPRKQGYQLKQAMTGIGAGQKTGRGPRGATQTQLNFIPEHHTDFIFAVVGEEFGFAGCAVVLALYALLLWRALRVLTLAKNVFGAMVAGGIAAMMAFQIFVNVGMTIGIMPITGVPLPLMSYGGSSVIVTFIAIGLLQSIHVQGRLAQASKPRDLIG
jgi:rod shape determining protein RodA